MTASNSDCAPFADDLSAWLDSELSSARASEIRDHLASCDHCRATLAELRRVDLALAASAGAGTPEVSDGLRARLGERIDAPTATWRPAPRLPARATRRRLTVYGSTFALAASLALYLALSPGEPPPDEGTGLPVDLASAPDESLAVVMEFDTIQDLDVIANLDWLEKLAEIEGGAI